MCRIVRLHETVGETLDTPQASSSRLRLTAPHKGKFEFRKRRCGVLGLNCIMYFVSDQGTGARVGLVRVQNYANGRVKEEPC